MVEAAAVIADAEATPRIRVSYRLLTAELEAAEAEAARLGGAAAAAEEKLRHERYARQREQVRSAAPLLPTIAPLLPETCETRR